MTVRIRATIFLFHSVSCEFEFSDFQKNPEIYPFELEQLEQLKHAKPPEA